MTNEEAINVFEWLKNLELSCEEIQQSWISPDCQFEAFIIAIKALEKQIPKKPNISRSYGFPESPYFIASCSVCGNILIKAQHAPQTTRKIYCNICGQKIDWT